VSIKDLGVNSALAKVLHASGIPVITAQGGKSDDGGRSGG